MTSIPYDNIYSSFLGYVNDYDIANLSVDDIEVMLHEYLVKATSKLYFRELFSFFKRDEDYSQITFELKNTTDESLDSDFVLDLISKNMVVQWLQPEVKKKSNIAQMFTGKDNKFYSQASHLNELRQLLRDTELEARKMISERGIFCNSYIGDK